MLTIRCELLLGSYQAADPFGDSGDVEWPPHPYRLHAALVNAACEAGGLRPDGDAVAALRWFESQGPPEIACDPTPAVRTTATSWVPRNVTRGAEWSRLIAKGGDHVSRVGRLFPTAVPSDPVVTFAWADAGEPHASLADLVERVWWLGSSRSPVACALASGRTQPSVFAPSRDGVRQLRVAATGVTDALLSARFSHPAPAAGIIAGYRALGPAPSERRIVEGPFVELLVRRIDGATQNIGDAAMLGAALRAAVLARAGDDAPDGLHGHDLKRGHAAYLTLADVGHTAARGSVRGVALALPSDMSQAERRASGGAFAAVQPLALPGGRLPLPLHDEIEDLWTLSVERWIGPAAVWSTVTPIILDRFPRRGRTPYDELLASVENAGLPKPVRADLLAGPPLVGGPVPGRLRGEVPPGMRAHARLHFSTPVRGPVLIGRGRFRGVGLLAPAGGA